MNRVLLAAAAFILSSLGLAIYPATADPISPGGAPVNWTGFYAGANVGYGWSPSTGIDDVAYSDNGDVGTVANGWFPGLRKSKGNALSGGVQAGYNHQVDGFVFGVEADLNYTGIRNKYRANDTYDLIPYPDATEPPLSEYNYHLRERLDATSRLEWFGSIRPRIGFTATDRLLVYTTGGLAFGGVKSSASYKWQEYGFWWCTPECGQDGAFNRTGGFEGSKTEVRLGWVLGAGAEYALTDNVSLKAEYLYTDLGSKRHIISYTGEGDDESITWKDAARFQTLRLGMNYRF